MPGTGRAKGPPWLAEGTGKTGLRPHIWRTTSLKRGTLPVISIASRHTSWISSGSIRVSTVLYSRS